MFTAIMRFHFSEDLFNRGCAIWLETVPEAARAQKGCIQIQLLAARPYALAIGTWQEADDAQGFMKTGIFDILLEKLRDVLAEKPEPSAWTTLYTSIGK